MNNEYYYLSELENLMDGFLEKENGSSEFGWLGASSAKRMAEAAFAVLRHGKELQDFLIEQGELKP